MTQLVSRLAVSAVCAALSVALVFSVLSVALIAAAAQTPPPLPAAENGTQFLVFFRSQPIGREEVLVLRMADGWIVRGTSRLGPPIDITTRIAQVDYDLQWRPKSLLVDGIVRGQDVTLKTTFDGTQGVERPRGAGSAAVEGGSGVGGSRRAAEHLPRLVRGAGAAPAGQDRRLGAARVHRAAGGDHDARDVGGAGTHRDAEGRDQRDPLRDDVQQSASGRRSRASTCGPMRTAACCA